MNASGWSAMVFRGGTAVFVLIAASCATSRGPIAVPEVSSPRRLVMDELTPPRVTLELGLWREEEVVELEVIAVDIASQEEYMWLLPFSVEEGGFVLPVDRLHDRRSYRYRFSLVLPDRQLVSVGGEVYVTLALGLPGLTGDSPSRVSLSRSVPFAWRIDRTVPFDGDGVDTVLTLWEPNASFSVRRKLPFGAVRYTTNPDELPEDLFDRRARLLWQVRCVTTNGILGPSFPPATVSFDPTAALPTPFVHAFETVSVVDRVVLSWKPILGAKRYTVEVDPPDGTRRTIRTTVPRIVFNEVFGGEESRSIGAIFRWRVRAEGEARSPFSVWGSFQYRPLLTGSVVVLPPRTEARVRLGGDDAPSRDERPEVEIVLSTPFAMMRHEITTEVASALLTHEWRAGMVRQEGEWLVDTYGRKLCGFGQLTFGQQFSLEIDEGEVRARSGYEGHPAVGITWYGALVLANALSRMEGRAVAQRISADGVEVDFSQGGYRLPTEAEWALAAGLLDRDEVPRRARDRRPLSGEAMRRVNHLRSGDQWESGDDPYTQNGGPTVPVGALGPQGELAVTDLLGNVWEWVFDWYDPLWYSRLSEMQDPTPYGPAQPYRDIYGRRLKVVRGGAWNSPREDIRIGERGAFGPAQSSYSIGVRLVRTITP